MLIKGEQKVKWILPLLKNLIIFRNSSFSVTIEVRVAKWASKHTDSFNKMQAHHYIIIKYTTDGFILVNFTTIESMSTSPLSYSYWSLKHWVRDYGSFMFYNKPVIFHLYKLINYLNIIAFNLNKNKINWLQNKVIYSIKITKK